MAKVSLRAMRAADWPAVASLIQVSTNGWCEQHGRAPVFACEPDEMQLFCRVYEALDPGCCVVAEDAASGELLGSCFYHPRLTHVSLGIMNAHPKAFGRGVARQLLGFITGFAARERKPVRLVSSAMNLDSFSLYNRAGFVPFAVYQDMIIEVPAGGLTDRPPGFERARDATRADVAAMVRLETELVGIDRVKDFEYFVANDDGIWHVSVLDDPWRDGELAGFVVSVADPASNMLGPGVMRTPADALALIARELDQQRGRTPVFLLPADRPELTERAYAWGARNCEMHLGQVLGSAQRPLGVSMPTFMPETG